MQKLKLGQKVSFNVYYARYCKTINGKYGWSRNRYKYWEKMSCDKKEGIVVGLRTLSNGSVNYDSEEGYTYTVDKPVLAALVAISVRYSIIKVPLEDIIVEE